MFFFYNFDNIVLNKKISFFLVYFNFILSKFVYGYLLKVKYLYIFVKPFYLIYLLTFLKNNSVYSANSLLDVNVVDNPLKTPFRFEVNYVFWNYNFECRLMVKLFVDGITPILSAHNLFYSSNWLEREIWDMFGIRFLFHPNLRRILTDYGFKGHPLRKDFPLIGYVDIFYDDSIQAISITPLELSQKMRFYNFENPWNKWNLI